MTHLMNTYSRLPVAFTHGRGAWLTDEQGREYLDALAGIAVNGLGHAHPRLVAALAEQVGRLIHTSNIYQVREQEQPTACVRCPASPRCSSATRAPKPTKAR